MDRALSDRLRDRLGITEEQSHDTTGVLATPAEMRSLRAMLRLSMKQLGARLGCQAGTISAWERGLRPVRAVGKFAARLTTYFAVAKEMHALTRCDPGAKPPQKRPASGFEYMCKNCGKLRTWQSCWVEIRDDGSEVCWHGKGAKRCGPMVQGGRRHRDAVEQDRGGAPRNGE